MMAASHRSARTLFERVWRAHQGALGLPDPSPQSLQLFQSVAALETSYASPAAWMKNTPEMANSNNYGAIQCHGPGPNCVGGVRDHKQDGSPYTWYYRTYPDAESGVLDLLKHLTRTHTKPAIVGAESVEAFAAAMYRETYFGGLCPDAWKKYDAERGLPVGTNAVGRETSQVIKSGAVTEGGQACDAEAKARYAAKLKQYVDEIAAAMQEEPVKLSDDLNLWPILALLAVAVAGGVGYYVYTTYYAEPPPGRRVPIRRNAGRAEWRALYQTTCGTDRDARRLEAKGLAAGDRAEARAAGRVASKASRTRDRARARAGERRADADRPCADAKTEMLERTERDKREASERRTPKQREASRRTLERQREIIEAEANNIEEAIRDEYGSDLAHVARREFVKQGGSYIASAKRETARHPRSVTTPSEQFLEDFAENLGEMRARLEDEREELEEPDEEEWAEMEERREREEERARKAS